MERNIKIISKIILCVTFPLFVPLLMMFLLLWNTYMSILPLSFRTTMIGMLATFSLAAPLIAILLLRLLDRKPLLRGYSTEDMSGAYMFTLISLLAGSFSMWRLHIPTYLKTTTLLPALIVVMCMLASIFGKHLSLRAASSGMCSVAFLWYGLYMGFNPIMWISAAILLGGLSSTGEIILRRHSLFEVFGGFLGGLLCGVIGILFL